MDFLANVMTKDVRPFKVWLGFLLFIKMLLETAKLLPKNFTSGFSLCKLYFVSHKSKDTSPIPQPNVQHLVYVLPIVFCYHKCFNNFHLSKNMLLKKFFYWNMFSSWFYFYDTRQLSVSPWSKIISSD